MRSSSREEVVEVLDALEAGYKRALDLTFDVLTTPERLAVLERFERMRRQQPAIEHALINQLSRPGRAERVGWQAGPGVGGPVADQPRRGRRGGSTKPKTSASGGRSTGSPWRRCCPPPPPPSATASLGAGHVAVIRGFVHRLPDFVDIETRANAEAQLARLAGEHRPDELAKLADKLTDCLNPDGDFTDIDRAKRRGLTIGRQDLDGMTPISGWLNPEARATSDAVLRQTRRTRDVQLRRRRTRASAAPRRRPPSRATPAALGSAIMTPCWPPPARCWPPVSWVSTTGCRPASS